MNDMKSAVESSSRMDQQEKKICELEGRSFVINHSEQKKVKRVNKSKESLHELRDIIK